MELLSSLKHVIFNLGRNLLVSLLIFGSFNPVFAGEKSISKMAEAKPDTTWEIRTAPLALWAQWITLEGSYRVSEKWATGPSAVWYAGSGANMFAPTARGVAAGWVADYYFKSVKQNSGYLSFHAYYEKHTAFIHSSGEKENEGFRSDVAIGKMWRNFGTVLMAGIGAEFRSYTVGDYTKLSATTLAPFPEFYHEDRWGPFFEFKMGVEF